MYNYIPTGFEELDKDLGGGLRKCSVTTISGTNNSGTTGLAIQISSNLLKSTLDFKVLHINLDDIGAKTEVMYFSKLRNEITNLNQDKIKIINKNFLNYSIDLLLSEITDVYQTYKFDLIIIDYPQLLEAKGFSEKYRLVRVFRLLNNISRDFNCAVLTIAKGAVDIKSKKVNLLNEEDTFDIAKMSNVIIGIHNGLNIKDNSQLIVSIDKNPKGKLPAKTYKIEID